MTEPSQEVVDAVKSAAVEGRITCARLRRVAEEIETPYRVVGKVADDLGVRVKECDLGCF